MGDNFKRDFAQTFRDFDRNEIRMSDALDAPTLQAVAMALKKALPSDIHTTVKEALNKALGEPLTLSRACTMALGGGFRGDDELNGEQRIQRYKIGMRLRPGMVRISPTERDVIKGVILKRFPESLVSSQALMMLEGESLEPVELEEGGDGGDGGDGGGEGGGTPPS